jgi:hypothetical protein
LRFRERRQSASLRRQFSEPEINLRLAPLPDSRS